MSGEIVLYLERRGRDSYDRPELLYQALLDYTHRTGRNISASVMETIRSGGLVHYIRKGPWGKPFLNSPFEDIYYSFSHSGNFEAVLVADHVVGLDIEDSARREARKTENLIKIAERFFTEEEFKWVRSGAKGKLLTSGRKPDIQRAFFEIWTAKESYVKYTGKGLTHGLHNFSVLEELDDVLIEQIHIDQAPELFCSCCIPLRSKADNVTIKYYD